MYFTVVLAFVANLHRPEAVSTNVRRGILRGWSTDRWGSRLSFEKHLFVDATLQPDLDTV